MRTSISLFSAEDLVPYQKLHDYSAAYYRAKVKGDEKAKLELARLTAEIPSDILSKFLHAREFSHAIDIETIKLAAEGVIDKLIICLKDAPNESIQLLEQEELTALINKNGLAEKISMRNGTDEAGAEMVMHALYPEGCDAHVIWLADNTDFTAMYENRPFTANLNAHMSEMNIRENPEASNIICIVPPKQKQLDLAAGLSDDYKAYTGEEIEAMNRRISELVENGNFLRPLEILQLLKSCVYGVHKKCIISITRNQFFTKGVDSLWTAK